VRKTLWDIVSAITESRFGYNALSNLISQCTIDTPVLDVEMASKEIADVPGKYNINTFDNSVLDV
jgi:hypothetical protein